MNSVPKTVTRQHLGCNLNPGPSAAGSSTLTTRPPSHPVGKICQLIAAVGAGTQQQTRAASC